MYMGEQPYSSLRPPIYLHDGCASENSRTVRMPYRCMPILPYTTNVERRDTLYLYASM